MNFSKWLWRIVVLIIIVFMLIAGYRLSSLLLKSQTLGPPTLAQVSLLDGSPLALNQLSIDQELITVAATRVDLQMSWDGVTSPSQLVIDPRKLPAAEQNIARFKWLVAVPKDLVSEKRFCVGFPDSTIPECYRFSRAPKSSPTSSITSPINQLTPASTAVNYPRTLISIQSVSDDTVSLFVTLDPYKTNAQNTVNPSNLFIRITSSKTDSVLNADSNRINRYPFVQMFLKKGISVTIEAIDKSSEPELIYDVQTIPQLDEGAIPLKSSAPVIAPVPSLHTLPTLNFHWLGTGNTSVDSSRHLAIDHSSSGHEFSTQVKVDSAFQKPVKIQVQMLDDSTTFNLTVKPDTSDEVLVNIHNLSYGQHRLQLNAILPDGQKTADVVIPFEYQAAGWY